VFRLGSSCLFFWICRLCVWFVVWWEWPKMTPLPGNREVPGTNGAPLPISSVLINYAFQGPLRPGSCRPRDAPDSGHMQWKMGSTLLFLAGWDIFSK